MTRRDLVKRIAGEGSQGGLHLSEIDNVLTDAFEEIAQALSRGERVTFKGFGAFTVVNRQARKGRNPATGEVISVRAKRVVKFKMSKVAGIEAAG